MVRKLRLRLDGKGVSDYLLLFSNQIHKNPQGFYPYLLFGFYNKCWGKRRKPVKLSIYFFAKK